MEVYEEILLYLLKRESTTTSSALDCTLLGLVETECYRALQKIKAVVTDDSLSDPECFARIEEIVCILESIGIGGGNRHDFG